MSELLGANCIRFEKLKMNVNLSLNLEPEIHAYLLHPHRGQLRKIYQLWAIAIIPLHQALNLHLCYAMLT